VQVYLMFQHVVTNFDTKFVMKADDDTFINVPALLHMLHKLTSNSNRFFYIGMRLSRDWCVWPRSLSGISAYLPVNLLTDGHTCADSR